MAELIKHLPSYQIRDGVYLVEGAIKSAIYNTNDGNVYSINKPAEEIILSSPKETDFFNQLIKLGLVDGQSTPSEPKIIAPPPDKLDFIWLNLTSRCNLKCLHCYNESSPSNNNDKLTTSDWKSIIDQSFSIGCRQLQFIGGEPMLDPDILQLAKYARNVGFDFIEIFSNGTLITREDIKKIRDLEVNVAISLYSDQSYIHDQITTINGSFNKTIRTMELLKESGISTRVGVIAMRQNQDSIEETLSLVKHFGFNGGDSPDIVRSIGRGNDNLTPNELLVRKYGLMTCPSFITNLNEFIKNYFYNPCWYGKISVDSSGEIFPCVAAKDKLMGVFKKNNIQEIISSQETYNLRTINKDKIETCCVCEYRYACGDCRPLSETETHNLYGKSSRCTYNPLSGNWL